jgi:DNA-binding MarR family transcriptional regulator
VNKILQVSPETAAEILEKISQISYTMGFSGGLRPAQWNALRYFGKSEDSIRTGGHFARYNMTTPSSASQTINAMVARGILKRTRVSGDRRTYRIDLTEAGRALLANDPIHHLIEAIAEMPEDRRFDFAEHLEFLLLRMLERATDRSGK